MKTFDVHHKDGWLLGFEVSNLLIGRRGVARLLGTVPGIRITKRPAWFRDGALFCSFELDGSSFFAEEPCNDSSRFLIAATSTVEPDLIRRVREPFDRAPAFRHLL
jgi:hypothetical protein